MEERDKEKLKFEDNQVQPTIEKISSTKVDLPPSCVEFWLPNPEYFVIGTYYLEKSENPECQDEDEDRELQAEAAAVENDREGKAQSRSGSLILFRLAAKGEITKTQTLPTTSAILDLHFSPHKPDLLALASSTGTISLYAIRSSPIPTIEHLKTFQPFPTSTLILSLAWHAKFPEILGVTLSTGTVALLQLQHDHTELVCLRDDLSPHNGQLVWTLAFSPPQPFSFTTPDTQTLNPPQGIYSGGDDSRLRCVTFPSIASLRHSAADLASAGPGGAKGLPGHDAGVTAILPLPLGLEAGKDILLTGSYDDCVRVYAVYDYRLTSSSTKPTVLASLNLGGGVWRLKFLRDYSMLLSWKGYDKSKEKVHSFRILASCMYAGARVLEVRGSVAGEWSIRVLGEYTEHASMNYACDVQPVSQDENGETMELDDSSSICVSTSFYDQLLCVWRFGCELV